MPFQLNEYRKGSRCYTLRDRKYDNLDRDNCEGEAGVRSPGEGRDTMEMVRWEYRIINIRSENYRIDPAKESDLNALGEEGWELVAITAINYKTAATDHIGMVFKRRKA
jgi:hypothetical protein